MLTNKNNLLLQEKTIDKRNLPAEITSLPIFQVIGNHLPAAVKTPEGKKNGSVSVFLDSAYWGFICIF